MNSLDSRQRKKQHTEKLEEEKKQFNNMVTGLQDALGEMRLREEQHMREKAELQATHQQMQQYIEQLLIDKEKMIQTHTLETGQLREKNTILREHVEKLESSMSASTASAFDSEFSEYENIGMDNNPWDDFSMVNDFSVEPEHQPQPVQAPQAAPAPSAAAALSASSIFSKVDVTGEKPEGSFSWNTFYMCLLFGAFIASNSSIASSTPAIPNMSEEYRAESANVLNAVLASASADSAAVAPPFLASNAASTQPSATISGAEMARMSSSAAFGGSSIDNLHATLTNPTKQQREAQAFAVDLNQYNSLTGFDESQFDGKPAHPTALQQAFAAMQQGRSSVRPAEVQSRSVLWDHVPPKVVADFRRMVRECGQPSHGNDNLCKSENVLF